MANTTRPLTNTEVKQAKSRDKEYNLADGEGLALRVKPNGSKYWLFNYTRPYTKKRSNIGFGSYPDVSLAIARERRSEARKLLAQNIDPKEHRDETTQKKHLENTNTLERVAELWFEVKKSQLSADYASDVWRSLELHIFPQLGQRPIHKISAPKAIDTLNPIAAKGNLETVKRLCQRLNEIMVHALNTGIIDSNPLAGISNAFMAPVKSNLPTIRPEQLPELMYKLSRASITITTRCIIEWQLHTMVRPGEAAQTQWKEIDLDNKQWTIPAHRMKSKKRDHVVPLSKQAVALLEVMRPISGHREYVFPADRDPRKHINKQTANMALKRMGYGGTLVAHGMRSIASTALNEQGFDPDAIEAALSHIDGNEVRAAYNRSTYIERRKVIMNAWSEYICDASKTGIDLTQITA